MVQQKPTSLVDTIPMQYQPTYDYIFAGGGCAALSLTYYMNQAGLLHDKTVLLIDKEDKNQNDRTWSFWTKIPTDFESIVYRSWQDIRFIGEDFNKRITLTPYNYQIIRGIDFYEYTLAHLQKKPNIHFCKDTILQTKEKEKTASIQTTQYTFEANYIFNSCFTEKLIQPKNRKKEIFIRQHFKGWIIETEQAIFDTSEVRLFDFRTPQNGAMRFFYILPFSPKKALIEYTLFSEHFLSDEEYTNALKNYISQVLKIDNYQIIEEEKGSIPMTTFPFQFKQSSHIINIGTLGGCSKASTGYTFLNIQKQAKAIVQSLQENQHPFIDDNTSKRHQLYDAMLLKIIRDKADLSEKIFTQLFKNNSTQQILQFLDEESNFAEELKIMSSVSPLPFIQSFFALTI